MTVPAPSDSFRCPDCEALPGSCACRDFRHGDVILSKTTGQHYLAEHTHWDGLQWVLLLPIGRTERADIPLEPVLLSRVVEGQRLPVVDLDSGDLLTVKP